MKPFIPHPKSKAYRSKKYLDFIRKQPCIFGHGQGEPHHVGLGRRGTGIKAPDSQSVSLCRSCHDKVDRIATGLLQAHVMENIVSYIEKNCNVDIDMMVIDFLTEYMQKEKI